MVPLVHFNISVEEQWLSFTRTMYQRNVDVDMLNAVKSVLADDVLYIVRFTATPTQTKTSSHRD